MIPRVEIAYVVDGAVHALRHRPHPPSLGEFVRLRDGLFLVDRVVWREDGKFAEHADSQRVDAHVSRITEG